MKQKIEVELYTDKNGKRIASIGVDGVEVGEYEFDGKDELTEKLGGVIKDYIEEEFEYPLERKHYYRVNIIDVALENQEYSPAKMKEIKKKIFPFNLRFSLKESDIEFKDIKSYVNDLIDDTLRKKGYVPDLLIEHTYSIFDYRLEELVNDKVVKVVYDHREKKSNNIER